MPRVGNSPNKYDEYPVTPKIEHVGRGAVKEAKIKTGLRKRPGKLSQTETGKHKKDFRP